MSSKTFSGADFRGQLLDRAVKGQLSPSEQRDIKCVIVLSESQGGELPYSLLMLQKIGQITEKKVAIGGKERLPG